MPHSHIPIMFNFTLHASVYNFFTWWTFHMSMFALLGGGVRVRAWIREQRKIKRRSKALLSLWWQTWTSLEHWCAGVGGPPLNTTSAGRLAERALNPSWQHSHFNGCHNKVQHSFVCCVLCVWRLMPSVCMRLHPFWKSKWEPQSYITDYSDIKITAINKLFLKTQVYLCEFHREQAWER